MATAQVNDAATAWQLRADRGPGDALILRLTGRWTLDARLPLAGAVLDQALSEGRISRVACDAAGVAAWDSGLVIFLRALAAEAERRGIIRELAGLPEGLRRLLALAAAVPERKDTSGGARRPSFLARIGISTLGGAREARELLAFLGEATQSSLRLVVGKARF